MLSCYSLVFIKYQVPKDLDYSNTAWEQVVWN